MTQWRLFSEVQMPSVNGDIWMAGIYGTAVRAKTEVWGDFQSKFYTAFTATDIKCFVGSQTFTGAFFQLQKNEVNAGNVSISLTTTGWIEDLTDSVTLSANDRMNWRLLADAGMHSDNVYVRNAMLTIEHASIDAPMMCWGEVPTTSITEYAVMGSSEGTAAETTEADAAHNIERATTVKNLYVKSVSGSSQDFDLAPSISGTPSTTLTVNITGTGITEDTSGTQTYAVNNSISWANIRTAGSMSSDQVQLETDTPEVWLNCKSGSSITTRVFLPFDKQSHDTSVDDNYFMRIGTVSAGHLVCNVSTAAATSSVSARVDSTNSTNLTIDTSSSGYLEDLTGSDSIVDGTSLQITAVASSGTLAINFAALECPWTDPGGPSAARRVIITSD